MMCELCHKNMASEKIHISFLGQMKELNVCDECAEKHGFGNPFSGLPDVLGFLLLGLIAQSLSHADDKHETLECEHCHMTFGEFRESGVFGCAHCYDSFHDVIEPMIRRIHGSAKHIGNKPANLRSTKGEKYNLKELEEKLAAAIENENYEEAARIRDLITDVQLDRRIGHE